MIHAVINIQMVVLAIKREIYKYKFTITTQIQNPSWCIRRNFNKNFYWFKIWNFLTNFLVIILHTPCLYIRVFRKRHSVTNKKVHLTKQFQHKHMCIQMDVSDQAPFEVSIWEGPERNLKVLSLGEPSKKNGKSWSFGPTRGGGSDRIPTFWQNFPKLNLPCNCS